MRCIIFFNLFLIPGLLLANGSKINCTGKDKYGVSKIELYSRTSFGLANDSFNTHSLVKIGKKNNKSYVIKQIGNQCFCSGNDPYNDPDAKIKDDITFIFSTGQILCKELISLDQGLNDRFEQGDISLIVNKAFGFLTSICMDACSKTFDKQKAGKYLCKVNNAIGKNDWSCEKQ